MSELADWFKSLPLFTRHWFGFTVALSIIGRFGIFNPGYLFLDYYRFVNSFHVIIQKHSIASFFLLFDFWIEVGFLAVSTKCNDISRLVFITFIFYIFHNANKPIDKIPNAINNTSIILWFFILFWYQTNIWFDFPLRHSKWINV